MSMNKEFMQAVEEKDVLMVRIMLKDSMVIDPTFKEFNEMEQIAKQSIPNLFDVHNGEAFENNEVNWTKDYMDDEMVNLLNNFSVERVSHLKKVCAKIYADRICAMKNEDAQGKSRSKSYAFPQKQVGTGLAVGGAAAAIVGIVASKPLVIGIGVVAALAGGIMLVTDN